MRVTFQYNRYELDPDNFDIKGVWKIMEYSRKIYIHTRNKEGFYGNNGFDKTLIQDFRVEPE